MSTITTTPDADLFGLSDDDETIPQPEAAKPIVEFNLPPAVRPNESYAAKPDVAPTITPTVVESTDSDSQLTILVKDAKLERDSAALVLATFNPLVKRVQEWAAKIDTIIPPNREPTVSEHKVIKETRLALVKVRTGADKKRKEILEDTKRFTAAMNEANRRLVDLVAPLEEKLEAAEKFAERQVAERKAKQKAERDAAMLPFGTDTSFYNFGEMSEESFRQLYAMTKANHEAKIEAARKAEEERLAKEAADRAEQARVRVENERLKADADRLAKEKADADAKAAQAKAAADAEATRIKADADRKLAEERAATQAREKIAKEDSDYAVILARVEGLTPNLPESDVHAITQAVNTYLRTAPTRYSRQLTEARATRHAAWQTHQNEINEADRKEKKRLADEKAAADAKARKDREIAEAALAAERKKAAEAAAETQRLKDEEAARLAEIEAAKKRAAAAPEKEKLRAFAVAIRELRIPDVITPEAAAITAVLRAQREKFAVWVEKQAEGL